jgi:tetratricopeptide (TPR) repeat protein
VTHYDDDTLSRFALDPALVEDAGSVAAHISACDGCRARLDAFAEVDDAMRTAETWANVETLAGRSAGLERTLELEVRLDEEDRAAERLLAPLLTSPLRFRDANIAENPRAQHAGVVRQLCAAAHRRHEEEPPFSLLLARTAYAIAFKLTSSPHMPRRLCLALALREGANAFRYLGRFAEALKALKDAEKLFDESPASDPHDIAIVWLIRATVFLELGQLDDAQLTARRATQVFRDYSDRLRELLARLVDASCLYLTDNNVEAAAAYEDIATLAQAEGIPSVLARARNDAANAYLNLEQFELAERCYIDALVLFDELGLVTEKARVGWSLALVLVRRGELAHGAEQLDAARHELQRLGLLHDSSLATLDWAAARLALGETAGVAEACKSIVIRFESEGMMRNARLALAYVQEALARQTATPVLLQQVRAYLTHLPTRPDVPFVPVR